MPALVAGIHVLKTFVKTKARIAETPLDFDPGAGHDDPSI
jgi:hypothetical protein